MSVQLSVPGGLHLLLTSIVMGTAMGNEEFHIPSPEREQYHGTGHGNFGSSRQGKELGMGTEDGYGGGPPSASFPNRSSGNFTGKQSFSEEDFEI